jgi:hypothetical protein
VFGPSRHHIGDQGSTMTPESWRDFPNHQQEKLGCVLFFKTFSTKITKQYSFPHLNAQYEEISISKQWKTTIEFHQSVNITFAMKLCNIFQTTITNRTKMPLTINDQLT